MGYATESDLNEDGFYDPEKANRYSPTKKPLTVAEVQEQVRREVEPAIVEFVKELPKLAKDMVKTSFLSAMGLQQTGRNKYALTGSYWDREGLTINKMIQDAANKLINNEIETMVQKEWAKIKESEAFQRSLKAAVQHFANEILSNVSRSFAHKWETKWDEALKAMITLKYEDRGKTVFTDAVAKQMNGAIDLMNPESLTTELNRLVTEMCLKCGALTV